MADRLIQTDGSHRRQYKTSLFYDVKQFSIADVMEQVFGVELIQVGCSMTTADRCCPYCGHRDCFGVNLEGNYWHCFSCEKGGDAVAFGSLLEDIPPYTAALKIAREFGLVTDDNRPLDTLPSAPLIKRVPDVQVLSDEELTRRRRILEIIVRRCEEHLWACPDAVKYQTGRRAHREANLRQYRVGAMPRSLFLALKFEGVCSNSDLKDLGLVNEKGRSVIGDGAFVYPLFDAAGNLVGLNAKDAEGKFFGQQRKSGHVGSAPFWGMQLLADADPGTTLALLEGQNDLLTLVDHGFEGVPLATLGTLKPDQLAWLADNVDRYSIVTLFDADDGGEKSRVKLAELFGSRVQHFVPPVTGQDPDDFLRWGNGTLSDLFAEDAKWNS